LKFLNKLSPERQDFHLHFETNGVLFDEVHWEQFSHLSRYNLSVTVTLDSLYPGVYRYLSGGFDKAAQVKENLKFLSGRRREGKIKYLAVALVVQECNFQEIPEYIQVFSGQPEYAVDQIMLKPLYKWFGMSEETYWFKNVLNPLHPYHREYLKILEDECWKNPKIYDWGCHNTRQALPHPLNQEKIYNRLLWKIFQNDRGCSGTDYIKTCIDSLKGKRIGFYGENEFSNMIVKLLCDSGADMAMQLTWDKDADGIIPKVSKQSFRPEMADIILLIDFYNVDYWFRDLPALGFQGQILTIEELIEGNKNGV